MNRHATLAGAAVVCLLAGLVLCYNLGGYALWDPDEGRHAEIARQLLTARDWRGWVVPSLNGRPYYDKPILFYWLLAAAYAVGGVNELTARAVPVAAALVTLLAVYGWGAARWGPRAAVAAGMILVTAGEFAALGRYANLDMLLTVWVTLGLLAFHRWTRRAEAGASLAPVAFWAGLGMLTKGLVAPALVGSIGLAYLAVTRQLHRLARARLLTSALVFLAVVGPWHLVVGLLEPGYLHELFVRHQYERFFNPAPYLHPGPFYYYVPMLLLCFLPWSVLLPATLRWTLSRDRRGPEAVFCLCWALGVFLFFSLSAGKLGTYILPALPPLALLSGRYVSELVARPALSAAERRLVGGGILVAAGLFFAAVPVLLALSWRLYGGALMQTGLLAGLMVPVAAVLVLLVRRGRHQTTPIVLTIGTVAALLVFYRWAAPQISAVRSEQPLAVAMAAGAPENATVPIVAYSVRARSLLFYVRRQVLEVDRPRQLARIVTEHPFVFVVTSAKHLPTVLAAGTFFPWHTGSRHVLYATRPPPETEGEEAGRDKRAARSAWRDATPEPASCMGCRRERVESAGDSGPADR